MNATNLIALIVAVSLAALAAGVYVSVTDQAVTSTNSFSADQLVDDASIRVLNVVAETVDSSGASVLLVQVTSDDAVRVNDTVIRVQTDEGSQTLLFSE
ncbi:MAG: hypothetical protein ACMXYD_05220 [Candidatus Woesearchaeota archaeon]